MLEFAASCGLPVDIEAAPAAVSECPRLGLLGVDDFLEGMAGSEVEPPGSEPDAPCAGAAAANANDGDWVAFVSAGLPAVPKYAAM